MSGFLAMGGFAPYVWSSYGLALAVLVTNIAWPYLRLRHLKRRIRKRREDD